MLSNEIIIIPLHQSLAHPSNYINETVKILSEKNSVILFDFFFPYSWKDLLKSNNLKALLSSFFDIARSKRIIYFRAPAILPFSKLKTIINLNKELGFWILSIFLWILKKNVIIWQFYALITKKIFKNQLFIYDCVDNMNLKDATKKFFYQEKQLFKTSDFVSFNSKELFENKLKNNLILAHKSIANVCGCNNKLFDDKVDKTPKEFIDIFHERKIIFMGVFDSRVDIYILDYVVAHNKDMKFIFIGPIRENYLKKFKKIIKEKNVLYLGEKEKHKLAPYLINCDLGIIPYNTKNEFVKYSNPMKAYEYLASGIPVVSTEILALKNYPENIVYTTDNKEDFSMAMKRIMDHWDNKKSKTAKNIADKNSWENKIITIEKFISKNEKTN